MNNTQNSSRTADQQHLINQQLAGVHAMREATFQQALALSEEFNTRREEAQAGFCNLILQVRARNEGRSIGVVWALMHFKGRKHTGTTVLPKPRGAAAYDLSTLKRKCPEWLQEIASEIEIRARPLREVLARLTKIEQDLRYIAPRLQLDLDGFYNGNRPSSADDDDLSRAFPTGDDQ